MEKITIAGYGYVGQAYEALLKNSFDINIYDPQKGYTEFGNPDAVIICVPTPQAEDGSCDMTHVFEVLDMFKPASKPVLIKSTISLEGWQEIEKRYSLTMISFSPEFLRAETAIEDVQDQNIVLVGGGCRNYWWVIFKTVDKQTRDFDPKELILAKYLRNSFLALKVSFFNQAYDFCDKLDIKFDSVREAVTMDTRIGSSHSYVTDERGFGGHCFPKDTNALVKTAQQNNVELSLLQEAIEYNNRIR